MIKLNGKELVVKQFPNGEIFIDVDKSMVCKEEENIVEVRYTSDFDLMALLYVSDFIKELSAKASLLMKYLPYSRMDRKEENRLFTLKTVAKFINGMGFTEVTVYEPHSDVSVGLLDRVEVVNKTKELTLRLLWDLLGSRGTLQEGMKKNGIYLVFPDGGASTRYGKQFSKHNIDNILEFHKQRDFNTGDIKSINLLTPLKDGDCKTAIIVDDLCSKGGTFDWTASILKEKGVKEVYLVVTHCEDTVFDGKLLTNPMIKRIYTTNSILTKRHEKINVAVL